MYRIIIALLLLTSCTPKCAKLISKCKEKGCLSDSSFVSVRDSVVIKDSVIVRIKDSTVYTSAQQGEIAVPLSKSVSGVKLNNGGWIKAEVKDSSIAISYYIPPTKEVYRQQETNTISDKEKVKERIKEVVRTVEVEKPFPKWLIFLSIFGGTSILGIVLWIINKFR